MSSLALLMVLGRTSTQAHKSTVPQAENECLSRGGQWANSISAGLQLQMQAKSVLIPASVKENVELFRNQVQA
jgi:hypothetical protein